MSQVVSSDSMQPMPAARPIRKECPPGACDCQREALLECLHAPEARILMLTREEEKRLIERIFRIASYEELLHVGALMRKNLGIHLHISPGPNEVRTVRGLQIHLAEQPGLCRKTRDTIPAAIRKCLENNPTIVYALLDAHDLLGATTPPPASPG
ncbi:hypothetical protein ABIC71_002803 [Herbaspirillum seropedicae]|uniref:hypothetical protein n=1 Tax=Herbaspirillum seropedicae TaxID=964 RepID=UPI000847F96C|nr:hypothetical protein [Herbaspirillum seropedicae]AON52542.1 hypothetical protein Hsc_0229 [Herbaspirillum seropedicae]MDR6395767.1 hypothetical protein [Herbaspirillum seropedicae]